MGDSVSGQIGECGRGVSADSICQHRSCGEKLGSGWPGQLILQSNRFEIRNVLKNAHLNARSAQHCQHCPCAEELGSRWKGQLILQSNCGGNMFQKMSSRHCLPDHRSFSAAPRSPSFAWIQPILLCRRSNCYILVKRASKVSLWINKSLVLNFFLAHF